MYKIKDIQCKKAAPKEKAYKIADWGGLYLLVKTDGGKYWRWDYRFCGIRKTMALGTYPTVTLEAARVAHRDARAILADGIDPMAERKHGKLVSRLAAINTFEDIGREWFERQRDTWVDSHGDRIIRRLERDIFPFIGNRPIASVTTPEMLAVLRRIEERGAIETAHRAKSDCSQIFRYAIETARAERDPTENFSRGALKNPLVRHHAAITDPKEFGGLLRAIVDYRGSAITRAALSLAPLVFQRPGELRKARWEEFDLDAARWEIPSERMKRPKAEKQLGSAHIVPLSRQAVAILRDLHTQTGPEGYLFPSPRTRTRPMSDNGILSALRRMGYGKDEMTGHGFRASVRTLAVERLRIPAEYVDHQLAHAVKDVHGRAYNRTQWLDERIEMMQRWADYCDQLATSEAAGSMEHLA
ncbi:Prophage integrase IntS [Paraburkholderia domus]|jgi:Integrase|uniref:tyrosine-type recombinase/integrase n=1 Tax=Paraburkholderia domus TaxID=2793075 RepID=UPI0019135253|nr:integrase arm-type DNA-binding domain-containing protein [Paraburkholderia domus]MBK5047141.1 integrase arm-type DNA-binding domain-containing protein [Burkholderia sp. R-70006]CAE6784117.1 Prophage integrase IntS [Paraburkholderia domus]